MKPTLIVTLTSAIALSPQQLEKITAAVEKKYTHNTLELHQVVEPTLLAGLKVTLGSQEIDASALAQLETLQLQIKENYA